MTGREDGGTKETKRKRVGKVGRRRKGERTEERITGGQRKRMGR